MPGVILNEGALAFLLQDVNGPVGLDLRRRAENVTTLLREGATTIVEQLNPDAVDFVIQHGQDGLEAQVGIKPGQDGSTRIADYLAAKEGREGKPFSPALDQGLHV